MNKEELKKISQEVGLKSGIWDSELCPKCGDFMQKGECVYCDYKKSKEEIKNLNK